MARPKVTDPKKQYTVMLRSATINEIDKMAKKLDLSRSQLMENLLLMGLDDARILDKSGALWLVKAGRKAIQFFKDQSKGNRESEPTKG